MQVEPKFIPLIKKAYDELLIKAKEDLLFAIRENKPYALLAKDYRTLYKASKSISLTGKFQHYNDIRFMDQFRRSMREYESLFEFHPNGKSVELVNNIIELVNMFGIDE